jgi:hypothetical protein
MKEKTMYLYICPDCKILLMKPDKRYYLYASTNLARYGVYVSGNSSEELSEENFDAYVCPLCGNTTHEGEGTSVLKEVIIPIKRAEELISLWREKYYTIPAREDRCVEWGIPLSDPRLKEILLEELV